MTSHRHGGRQAGAWQLAAASFAALVVAAGTASANGAFPASGQLLVDPGNPQHLVLRTTFGLVTSRDGGVGWDWVCEEAMGYANYEPTFAVMVDGTVFGGLAAGITVSHDGCAWSLAAGSTADLYFADVSVARTEPTLAVAVSVNTVASTSRVWESTDSAVTWAPLAAEIHGLKATTLDVAPSDTSRIYVSGLDASGDGAIARSDDHGATWTLTSVPDSAAGDAPHIGAIDPTDPDRLFVRLSGAPGKLFVSTDGAASWSEAFVGMGFLRAFALSPDGAELLVGGPSDGLWRAPVDTLSFSQVSSVPARCLTWTSAGVYACAAEAAGFFVGLSSDHGATFAPVLHLPCVRGPLDCPPKSEVGGACPAAWPAVADQIKADTCEKPIVDAGADADAEAPPDGGGSGGSSVATGPAGPDAGQPPVSGGRESDCGCALPGASRGDTLARWLTLALLVAVGRRRRRRG